MKLQVRRTDKGEWRTVKSSPISEGDLEAAQTMYRHVRFLSDDGEVRAADDVVGHLVFCPPPARREEHE